MPQAELKKQRHATIEPSASKTTEREETPMDEQAWQAESIEILTEIKAWRQAHPRATFMQYTLAKYG